jgi:hypothetical protein
MAGEILKTKGMNTSLTKDFKDSIKGPDVM